jgi:hypothetical protein
MRHSSLIQQETLDPVGFVVKCLDLKEELCRQLDPKEFPTYRFLYVKFGGYLLLPGLLFRI